MLIADLKTYHDQLVIGGSAHADPRILAKDAIARIEELEIALRSVVGDIESYERNNNLSPNPGKPDCWQSVTHAKAVLANT